MFRNPVITDDRGADHGDPFVLRHAGGYVLYHTTDDGDRGISAHCSTDLVHWKPAGIVLEPDGWAQTDLWAPEVLARDGEYLMYVSATTLGAGGEGVEADRRQGLARARDPLGPFTWDPAPLVRDTWSIDGHPFRAADGTDWLFYNIRTDETGHAGQGGSGNVVDRLLAPDRLEGRPTPVTFPSEAWEADAAGSAYWNEGSWVLERRGELHQTYSGGFYREATYGIGTAVAPAPRGPRRKDPANPIFRSGSRITGPGHHSVTTAPDGVTPYAVYHAYDGGRPGRKVHLDRLFWCGDRPAIAAGTPTEGEQPHPPGPAFDPAVAHWHAELWTATPVTVAGVPAGPGHVRVRADHDGLRVHVDGRLVAHRPGRHDPDVPAGAILTSHLDEDRIHPLPARWAWGGDQPLELACAVRGRVRLRAGDAEVSGRTHDGRYALLRLDVPGGAATIEADGEGEVTDLVATTRAPRR